MNTRNDSTYDVSCCNLNCLPKLPPTLKELWCYGNKLTFLPELPATLEILSCHNNLLTCLPELPPTLKEFWCYGNKLTFLPELPIALKYLSCGNFNDFVIPKDAYVVISSLFEICCNKVKEGDKTHIEEVDFRLGERKCCKGCGLFTVQRNVVKQEVVLGKCVVIKYFRCWLCINKIRN